jgi:hypothetical protein
MEQCWMPKCGKCEKRNLMDWKPGTMNTSQKVVSGVIRGRGANGAPKFSEVCGKMMYCGLYRCIEEFLIWYEHDKMCGKPNPD